jgi:hypothetical protein
MHAHGFVQMYVHGRGWFPFPHSAPRADSPPPLARRKMHALAGELCSRRGTRVHVIAYTLYVSGYTVTVFSPLCSNRPNGIFAFVFDIFSSVTLDFRVLYQEYSDFSLAPIAQLQPARADTLALQYGLLLKLQPESAARILLIPCIFKAAT